MVIIGLLLIALVCLAIGLITQSAVWLVASLIATGGAAFLLYKLRNVIGVPREAPPNRGHPEPARPEDVAKAAVLPRGASTADRDEPGNEPAKEPAKEPANEPTATIDDDVVHDDEVWVIDGRPRYHLGDCAIIKGQDAEPIPYEQATEDGFMPCSLCEPHAVSSPPS